MVSLSLYVAMPVFLLYFVFRFFFSRFACLSKTAEMLARVGPPQLEVDNASQSRALTNQVSNTRPPISVFYLVLSSLAYWFSPLRCPELTALRPLKFSPVSPGLFEQAPSQTEGPNKNSSEEGLFKKFVGFFAYLAFGFAILVRGPPVLPSFILIRQTRHTPLFIDELYIPLCTPLCIKLPHLPLDRSR